MPEITSSLARSVINLMNCIRTSRIVPRISCGLNVNQTLPNAFRLPQRNQRSGSRFLRLGKKKRRSRGGKVLRGSVPTHVQTETRPSFPVPCLVETCAQSKCGRCVSRRTHDLTRITRSPTTTWLTRLKISQLSYLQSIGNQRAFCPRDWGHNNMQGPEAYVGGKQRPEVRILEKEAREMQDALSRYRPSFHRAAYRQLGNAADAEDAVQDALLAAYKHLGQFKGQAQMSTWLTAIVTNYARMQLRRRLRQPHLSLDERSQGEREYCWSERLADCGPSPEDECRYSELRGRLSQFAARLSPPLRKAFQLRDLDGLTTSEAAHILGEPEGTVKAQLARARAKLRRVMRRTLYARTCSPLTSNCHEP